MEKKQMLKKMLPRPTKMKSLPGEKLKKQMPLPNKDRKMPILKDKLQKVKEPAWKKKDYKPGSIMRGYTKYA
jgi:hypothetical protein